MTDKSNLEQNLLVEQIKKREPGGMSLLFDNYSGALYGVISRIISDEMVAQEVLQDAFLKIWNKIDQYDDSKGRLFTWMINLSRNLAIDKLRSREMKKAEKTDDLENYVSVVGGRGEMEKVDGIGLAEVVASLREEERFLLEMIYFKGYTQSEITEEFGIPLGTVKTRLRMALINLRKILKVT